MLAANFIALYMRDDHGLSRHWVWSQLRSSFMRNMRVILQWEAHILFMAILGIPVKGLSEYKSHPLLPAFIRCLEFAKISTKVPVLLPVVASVLSAGIPAPGIACFPFIFGYGNSRTGFFFISRSKWVNEGAKNFAFRMCLILNLPTKSGNLEMVCLQQLTLVKSDLLVLYSMRKAVPEWTLRRYDWPFSFHAENKRHQYTISMLLCNLGIQKRSLVWI